MIKGQCAVITGGGVIGVVAFPQEPATARVVVLASIAAVQAHYMLRQSA